MTSEAVLITGAFGQVGRRCAQILLGRGHTVIATDLRTDTSIAVADKLAGRSWPGRLVVAYADLLDEQAMGRLVDEHQPRAIVHLAAMLSPASYRNPRLARKVNVEGTRNLVTAAAGLPEPPLVVYASSAAVYGSRNPHRHPELITPQTPVNPIDQYGEDKVLAEKVIADSGLPHTVLRLGAVISPDAGAAFTTDYLVLMRATPGDNRMHTVDARDVALAFANAVDRREHVAGRVLLIGGDDSHMHVHRDLEDDIMEGVGIGRLGPSASLPGDPADDRGWSFTGFFDTSESQALLEFQEHGWRQTLAWVAEAQGRRRTALRVLGPVIRPLMRLVLALQRRAEGRGRYADPWTLMSKKYGSDMLAPTDF